MSDEIETMHCDDALRDLHEWLNCLDMDDLARMWTEHVGRDPNQAVQLRDDCDERSAVYRGGRKMRVMLVEECN